jgi:hypothetical protein
MTRASSPIQPTGKSFSVGAGVSVGAQRIGIFGPGGAGKTELAANIKQIGMRPLFIDIENGSNFQDVERISTIETLVDLRAVLHNDELLAPFNPIVIDTLTRMQLLLGSWIVENIKNESNNYVERLSGYGYGKGYELAYETFLNVLGDLDALVRKGKSVIVICHECTSPVPNPNGEDWIRYEPRLITTKKGDNSIRNQIKEWVDHLFFVGYDVFVGEDGKGKGAGSRTIHVQEFPTHWAKSRCLSESISYEKGSADLWKKLFNKE